MLQRRHFELVARIIKDATVWTRQTETGTINRDEARAVSRALSAIAEDFARAFTVTNPRFDRDRFLRACGLE